MQVRTMTTNSVVKTVWKQRNTPQKTKLWVSFYIPRTLQHSKMNEETIRVNAEQIGKDNYLESKTI
jgi:hypothetical protein